MEASLSRRDTLLTRNSTIFRKRASRQLYGNKKSSPKSLLSSCFYSKKKILTWDNLQRFGFIGPSICYLCHLEVETMEHLLNNNPFSEKIWNQATLFMRRTKWFKNNIISTIRDWGSGSFKSPILNKTLNLLQGFIVWQLLQSSYISRKLFTYNFGPRKTSPLTQVISRYSTLGASCFLTPALLSRPSPKFQKPSVPLSGSPLARLPSGQFLWRIKRQSKKLRLCRGHKKQLGPNTKTHCRESWMWHQ